MMPHSEYKTVTGKTPFDFMKYKWLFIVVSAFFVTMSMYEISVKGINFGVDFRGGTKILFQFKKPVTARQIREAVQDLDAGDVQVIRFGAEETENQFMVRAKYVEGASVAELLSEKMASVFGADEVTVLSQEVVGPKVGDDLRRDGLRSIVAVCVLLLLYIGFRFDFLFAPGAVVALIHDVLVSVGFFSYFGKEFNLPILAALLTILGYSINDTIVIYDRIRENISRLPKRAGIVDVINISLTETMSRTVITALTTLFVVVVLFYFGGGVLHDFAFCLIIGIVFGTYSSIFIAAPLYLLMQKFFPHKGLKVTTAESVKVA